jgi:hypothetical protein
VNNAIHVPDILSTVLSRFQALSETSVACRLADVRIGPTNLWDAVRYNVADVIYDDTYRQLCSRELPESSEVRRTLLHRAYSGVREAVSRNLWRAQLGEEFVVGLLSARLGLLGDLLETGFSYAHRREGRHAHGCRADVLVAGSMYRTAVTALSPVLQRLGSHYGLEHLVLAHDDVLLRHGRAFSRLGVRWRHAAMFSNRGHRTAAREVVRRARKALTDARASEGVVLPEAASRNFLSERYLRRLVLNFLAAQDALTQCDPSVVVIPDERQPLARLVGLEARARGLPVVSAPLDRDQIYRKTPLWDSVVSTRILVFCPVAARFLARALPRLFEGEGGLTFEMNTFKDQTPLQSGFRQILELNARSRIVLFASQGQAHNAILLPMLKACTAALPDVTLVIRPHPHEWPPLVRFMNPGVHVSTALTARQAIQAADVLVTHSSFMAVEAALLCCPVILVSPDSVPNLIPLLTEGLARWVCTREELQRALEDLLGSRAGPLRAAQERFRETHAKIPGVESAAEVIAGLASR